MTMTSSTSITIREYLDRLFPQFEDGLKELIAENGAIKSFNDGDLLMDRGHYFKSTMLVIKGNISLYREGDDGNEFFVYMLGPGEGCALSMICALKHQTSELKAVAEDNTEVILIPLKLMDELMQKYQSWYYFVLDTYRTRFESLLEVIDSVIFSNLDERLEFYLKNKANKLGTKRLNIMHHEIANDLNTSREVITRLLKKMEQKGLVKLERYFIELK